jgi:phage-related protein
MSFGGGDFSVEGAIRLNVLARGLDTAARQLRGLQDQADQAAGSLRRMGEPLAAAGRQATSIGRDLTTKVTAPLLLLGGASLKAASDLNENMSAVDTVFGSAAGSVQAFAKTTADSLGISRNAALESATQLGALFDGVGIGSETAAEFSTNIITAAGDLASFYNVDPGTAMDALRSGLVGEAEPLRRFGILLDEASVQAKAFAMTGKSVAADLTDQEKVAARYTLIMEGLGAAQGDASRTGDQFAGRMRRLRATLNDTAAIVGQQLIPYAQSLAGHLLALVQRFQGLSPAVQRFIVIALGIAAALGPVLITLGFVAQAIAALAPVFAILTGPVGLVIAALVALGIAYKTNFLGFGDAVRAVAGYVATGFRVILDVLGVFRAYIRAVIDDGDILNDWLTHLPSPLQAVAKFIGRAINAFKKFGSGIGDITKAFKTGGMGAAIDAFFGGAGQKMLSAIGDLLSAPAKMVGDFLKGIQTGFAPLDAMIRELANVWTGFGRLIQEIFQGDFRGALDVGKRLIIDFAQYLANAFRLIWAGITAGIAAIDWGAVGTTLLNGLLSAVALIGDLSLWLLGKGAELLAGLLAGLVEAWPGIVDFLTELPGHILEFFGDAAAWLAPYGLEVITGLLNGIKAGADALWTFLGGVVRSIPTFFLNAATWLATAGLDLMAGLAQGIYDGFEQFVKGALGWVTKQIPDWKGPASRDRTLLLASGRLVMAGFERGLRIGFRDVERTLAHMTASLSGTATGAIAVPSFRPSVAASVPLIGGARSVTVNAPITVNGAGDPRAVALHVTREMDRAFGRLLAQTAGG